MLDNDLYIMRKKDDDSQDLVTRYERILKETDKGALIEFAPKTFMKWFPKKFLEFDRKNKLVRMPGWLINQYAEGIWYLWQDFGYHEVKCMRWLNTELREHGIEYELLEGEEYKRSTYRGSSGAGDHREDCVWETYAAVGPNM